MDSDFEHLAADDILEAEMDPEPCLHCSDYPIQESAIECSATQDTPYVTFDSAMTGRMAPYVEVFEVPSRALLTKGRLSETPLRYVKDGAIVSLRGAIHMRDVSPNGTWLSEKTECKKSITRLRLAGLMCAHLPELKRIVLEQKNDDGLLYLVSRWLSSKGNVNEGIDAFGPFVCEAMLAPVLHVILRSNWLEERKELAEANNELKLGWAQEFYDWKCVTKNRTGRAVFAHSSTCPVTLENAHDHSIVTLILNEMRCCGYTPWSAVQALRCSERRIGQLACVECKGRLLASCAFLAECAAAEASRQRDWLVRNEAVLQLCWLLYHIHTPPEGRDVDEVLESWTESTVTHSIRFQEYKTVGALSDAEALAIIFANDHNAAFASRVQGPATSKEPYDRGVPAELLEVISRNDGFSPRCERVVRPTSREQLSFNVSTSVDVRTSPPGAAEARAQELDVIARALALHFPRVAASALDDLTLRGGGEGRFSGKMWPVFVDSTRACYQLYKALALPVSPSPAYALELLARGWRRVKPRALERFIPMAAGGVVEVREGHYEKHLLGPVRALADLGLVSRSEEALTIRALRAGVLPCFAGEGDSAPDRVVSTTLSLTFAACGQRVFGCREAHADTGSHRAVTSAGLVYFAAWYVLVYTGTLHTQTTLKCRLSRLGSDADKHLCSALKLERVTGESEYRVLDYDGGEIAKALRIVFGGLLDEDIVVRFAELYVPELLAQLPYTKILDRTLDSVKGAIESRDAWFAKEHRGETPLDHSEPPFAYLGNLAHGLHSSIEGTLTRGHARQIAECDSPSDLLRVVEEKLNGLGLDDVLREAIDDRPEETFVDLDDPANGWSRGNRTVSEDSPLRQPLPSDVDEGAVAYGNRARDAREVEGGQASQNPQDAVDGSRLCRGLHVDSVDRQGFHEGHAFLTIRTCKVLRTTPRVTDPAIVTPCMANIASTVCLKTEKLNVGRRQPAHRTLIEALWVLFMHSKASRATPALSVAAAPAEPSTPEALAVMVHLAVKRFDLGAVALLGVCNDIKAVYEGECCQESEFVPIAAIVGGLFGVNVELNVNGYNYYLFNKHHRELWAPGSVCHAGGAWCVAVDDQSPSLPIPREKHTADCYHAGTLGAYVRLNDLKVTKVPSDHYCGFHTVALILGIGKCDRRERDILASRTAEYMNRNKDNDEINVYLACNNIRTSWELKALLMLDNRWLTVDEVNFMLKAHDKLSAVITEYSYPVYNPDRCHVLLKNQHFEPVMPT